MRQLLTSLNSQFQTMQLIEIMDEIERYQILDISNARDPPKPCAPTLTI